jgi:plastocyanin
MESNPHYPRRTYLRIRLTAAISAAILIFGLLSLEIGTYASAHVPLKAKAHVVLITKAKHNKFKFSPAKTTLKRGQKVKWVNKTKFANAVAANNNSWNTILIGPGKSNTLVFKKAGTFKYHSTVFTYMKGELIVKK